MQDTRRSKLAGDTASHKANKAGLDNQSVLVDVTSAMQQGSKSTTSTTTGSAGPVPAPSVALMHDTGKQHELTAPRGWCESKVQDCAVM